MEFSWSTYLNYVLLLEWIDGGVLTRIKCLESA